MAKRINIRGVIVGSAYDTEWAADYIQRGIFTPESTFRKALAEADGEPVEIYISSQGGDVVAGGEIRNAIAEYPGEKCVIVGAFAASMAANIALTAGCPVKAFSNSIFLYHGAWSVCIGGSGAMEDESRILDQINEPIKEALVAHGIPRGTVERGFSEGRAYTMNAREALAYGIVDEIIDGMGEAPETIDEDALNDVLAANDSALPVAAAAAWQSADMDADTHGQLFALQDRVKQADALIESLTKNLDESRAEHAAAVASLADAEKTLAETKAALEAATAKADALAADLDRSRAAHAALTGRVLAPKGGADKPQTWPEAVRSLGLDAAISRYPDLAAEYRRTHARKIG